ncbi:MAG: ATP-binding protein [Pseudomonadota bacterium]
MHTRDPRPRINGWALNLGSIGAGIAALAVMLMGETLGLWLGGAVLTTLIFLQIIFLRQRANKRPTGIRAIETAPAPDPQDLFENDPLLVISVSPHGRIRDHVGNAALLPGLKAGRVWQEVFSPYAHVNGEIDHAEFGRLTIAQTTTPTGTAIVIMPRTVESANLERALQERTNFFAGLGHDLKSPLNGIIGFADIMASELRGPLPEAYQDYPTFIRESGETLLRLVEDMLGYAKAEAGTYELDLAAMDIAASGESVLRQSKGIAELSGVDLTLRASGEVLALADAAAVRRIWDNLVSNAIKYCSQGDTVSLDAFEREGLAYLRVRDTGAGMSAEDLAKIAKPFSQGANAKGRAGTGLGLAMVQRLAELQGGQVKIETAPGQGTTVTVSLPGLAQANKRAAE